MEQGVRGVGEGKLNEEGESGKREGRRREGLNEGKMREGVM